MVSPLRAPSLGLRFWLWHRRHCTSRGVLRRKGSYSGRGCSERGKEFPKPEAGLESKQRAPKTGLGMGYSLKSRESEGQATMVSLRHTP